EDPALLDKALAEILQPEQGRRLRQILLQRQGTQAFSDPQVAGELGLSAEQADRIRGLPDDKRRLELLTEEQQARWQAMLGEPFKGEIHLGPPSGPPRGPGRP